MKLIISDSDKGSQYVIYKITCYKGKHKKEYHYIGLTKRKLITRVKEHIRNKACPVGKFIQENNVEVVKAEVIQQCNYQQVLDIAETINLCEYILKRGTKANQRNRLLNLDYKGLDKITLNEVEKIYNFMKVLFTTG